MLEIILIVMLSKKIAASVSAKGRNPSGYVILFIFLWIGGEIVGAVIGVLIAAAQNPNALDGGINPLIYLFALIGAAVGATISFSIANSVTPLDEPRRDDDEKYDRDRWDRKPEDDHERPARFRDQRFQTEPRPQPRPDRDDPRD